MVQAWRLFRFTMKLCFKALEEDDDDDIEFEKRMEGLPGLQKIAKKKEKGAEEEKEKRGEAERGDVPARVCEGGGRDHPGQAQ